MALKSFILMVAYLLLPINGNRHKKCVVVTLDQGSENVNECMTQWACTCYKKNQKMFTQESPPGVALTTHFIKGRKGFACYGGYWNDPGHRAEWKSTYSIGGKEWTQCVFADAVRQQCHSKGKITIGVGVMPVCDPDE